MHKSSDSSANPSYTALILSTFANELLCVITAWAVVPECSTVFHRIPAGTSS